MSHSPFTPDSQAENESKPATQSSEYSGITLGEVELFMNRIPPHADEPITQVLVMNGSRVLAGAILVPTKVKQGDRITLVFRLDPPV